MVCPLTKCSAAADLALDASPISHKKGSEPLATLPKKYPVAIEPPAKCMGAAVRLFHRRRTHIPGHNFPLAILDL
jgi:hypothetical protein